MVTTVLAWGYKDPPQGWGGIAGLGAAAFVCYLIWRIDMWRQKRRGATADPSPTGPGALVPRETAQVARVSSHPSHETSERGDGDGGAWYGRIVRRGSDVYRTARHVARTGESPPKEAPEEPPVTTAEQPARPELPAAYEPPGGDPEIDIPLVDELWDGEEEPDEEEVRVSRETVDEYVARCVAAGVDTAAIAQALQEHYQVSRATAYRIIQRVPGRRAA